MADTGRLANRRMNSATRTNRDPMSIAELTHVCSADPKGHDRLRQAFDSEITVQSVVMDLVKAKLLALALRVRREARDWGARLT
jgi:hypothetical protein